MSKASHSLNGHDSTIQLSMSPYYGEVDFSGVPEISFATHATNTIDFVSIADIFRNGFVYPPHSIFRGLKLTTFGFDPVQNLVDSPVFHFDYRAEVATESCGEAGVDWTTRYHQLLCDAVSRSCKDMRAPWMLQSGGKDSSSLAIALSETRPDVCCITYLGGHEENEVASARAVAGKLGLRHEALVCDPGRAWDRYVEMVGKMPLLTADFALLSYADLVTEIASHGGDGIIDGLGSDIYFGTPVGLQQKVLSRLARELTLPSKWSGWPLVRSNFKLCFVLSTLGMEPFERLFPGSRFENKEVDELLGQPLAALSRQRLELFREEITAATTLDNRRALSAVISEATGALAKGLYSASAKGLLAAYPYCDEHLRDWVYRELPSHLRVDPQTHANKVVVRNHIAKYFGPLPYVTKKGSFRFDLCGLAACRFEQVHDCAEQVRELIPGAVGWLEHNRRLLGNKYHASKFYLLAVALPWLRSRLESGSANRHQP